MPQIRRQRIFDIDFITATKAEALQCVSTLNTRTQGHSVLFANAHVVVESSHNHIYRRLLQKADIVVPDGVPISWCLNALGHVSERYSGPDFMTDLFNVTAGKKHFFIGSTPEVLEKIKERFPGELAGVHSPPFAKSFSEEEKRKHIEMIRASAADFIWVGLGAPKQEAYAVEMAELAGFGVWLAVGAAFDFYAGVKSRAPEALQKMGMEWAYRLATEPKRLAGRYLRTNPQFVAMAFKELHRLKKS